MFGLGTKEILIIAIVALVLFGSQRIPKLAKDVGEAIRGIRGASDESHSSGKKRSITK